MEKFTAPPIRKDFMLVVNREKPDLAAAVLSFLFQKGSYLPMFSFGKVEVSMGAPVGTPNIYAIQIRRAEEFAIFLNNAITENGSCENLVFVGLTDGQKSYISYLGKYCSVLEVDTHNDIDSYLGGFGYLKKNVTECSVDQAMVGLCQTLKMNQMLKIGSTNELAQYEPESAEGIIVVEDCKTSNVVAAINYAVTIGASVYLVEPLQEDEEKDVLYLLEKWSAGDNDGLQKVKDKIMSRIGTIDFTTYKYATFFTQGLPYPLYVQAVPTSMVNLDLRPDFFVFNGIISEIKEGAGSAVVFSPTYFKKDEETDSLISLFEFRNFYLRKLVGDHASNYNLKNTIEGYPFDVLHICSHGGNVDGENCTVKFQDNSGKEHIIEFDHVLSVALTPYQDMHSVETIYYFKRFNGLEWRSEELKKMNYSHELYASITEEIGKAFEKKKVVYNGRVARIFNTNAIKCPGFNYLANFEQFAKPDLHPLIFNNTCSSWMTVSASFLAGGARGYVGTLRDVNNKDAVNFALKFYDLVFDHNIVQALYSASSELTHNDSETIYIYWGLHFSTLQNNNAVATNRRTVIESLAEINATWKRKFIKGQGSPELVKGRFFDTWWMIRSVMLGRKDGHVPLERK